MSMDCFSFQTEQLHFQTVQMSQTLNLVPLTVVQYLFFIYCTVLYIFFRYAKYLKCLAFEILYIN